MALLSIRRLLLPVQNQQLFSTAFSTCNALLNKQLGQRANILRKLLENSKRKRPPVAANPVMKSIPGALGRESRRQTVLNALFMEHITDLMASGEIRKDLTGYGIEILKVMMNNEFSLLNVFWAGTGTFDDTIVQDILDRCAGPLRSELIGLNILGRVPQIRFVRDATYAVSMEVDRLLAKADFGDDYMPVHQRITEPVVLTRSIRKNTNVSTASDSLHMSEEMDSTITDDVVESVPMKMDILGLKHDELMTKVKEKLKKSRVRGQAEEEMGTTTGSQVNAFQPGSPSSVQDTKKFAKFLAEHKRQKQRAVMAKPVDTSEIFRDYNASTGPSFDGDVVVPGDEPDYYDEDLVNSKSDEQDKWSK